MSVWPQQKTKQSITKQSWARSFVSYCGFKLKLAKLAKLSTTS